jgi:DNA-binding MarR family transcriptional regulator
VGYDGGMLDRLAKQPTWLLSQASAHAGELLRTAFAAAGTRGYHYRLLAALEQFGATSQADLGRRSNIDPKDVVGALNELVERGFAQRRPDPTDARRNLVSITRTGRTELRRLDVVVAGVQAEIVAPLTAGERDVLVELLAKLGEA